MNENFQLEVGSALDGGNLFCRKFAGEDRAVETYFGDQVDGLRACKRHLRACVNFLRGCDGANQTRKPDVLNDEGIRFQRNHVLEVFGQFANLALKDEDVHGEERTYAAKPCVADHLTDIFEGKIFGTSASVPVRNAKVHGIGTVVDGRFEHLARADGQQKFRRWRRTRIHKVKDNYYSRSSGL